MTTKEWLLQYRNLNKLINEKLVERENILTLACKVTGSATEDKVKTSATNTSETWFIKYAEVTTEIDAKVDELVSIGEEIKSVIYKVSDLRLQTLLIGYYINGKTFEALAEDMELSEKWVRTGLHGQAINEIEKNRKLFNLVPCSSASTYDIV